MVNKFEKIINSESGADALDTKILEHNLKMLNKEMLAFINQESFGGNAGSVEIDGKRYPCAGANGYADPRTGEIKIFGNIQNIPKDIARENVAFSLRVAMDFKNGEFMKIIGFFGAENFSPQGKNVIESAINQWNEEHKQKTSR